MQVGDLVRNRNSEGGMLGIIVGWQDLSHEGLQPIVHWFDGRTSWIMAHRVEIINASR